MQIISKGATMKTSKLSTICVGTLLGILALVFSTAFGLGIIHISGFPFSADINALNISEASGLPKEEILANYNAVMEYLKPLNNADFDLPTLKFTEQGAKHFEDCRVLFNTIYLLGAISGFAFLGIVILHRHRISALRLKIASAVTLAIPVILGGAMLISFDRVFLWFHSILFEGGTWVFDPARDEIINILPAEFFMHCGLFIAAFWLLAAIALGAAGYIRGKSEDLNFQ